jgi:hypothetical protein
VVSVVQLRVNPKPLLVQDRVGRGDDECSSSLADAIQGQATSAAVATWPRSGVSPAVRPS